MYRNIENYTKHNPIFKVQSSLQISVNKAPMQFNINIFEQVYKVDLLMESTWRNFLVYFEGTLRTRISLREKRMNIMPTPLRVGGILCYVGQI